MENIKDSKASRKYHGIKKWVFFVGLFLDIAFLLILFFSGITFAIKDIAVNVHPNFFAVNGIYFVLISIFMYVIHFPLSLFEGFYWEHKFELSNQTFVQWFADSLKKNALGMAVGIILIEAIYTLLKISPNSWWVWATCFWLFISFVLAKIVPNVIVPMFFKYSPIEDEGLKARIEGLFESCKVAVKDISTIDLSAKTKKANAFLCGVGKQKRVVLSDTLVANFSNAQIGSVVAHELGHHKHNDIIRLLIVNTLATSVGFFLVKESLSFAIVRYRLRSIDDIALFPLIVLALMVFGFIITPLMNLYSRKIERAADKFCLDQTKDKHSFISMMQKLGEMNLAEFDPGFFTEMFFYDHPTLKKRIEFAEKYKIS